MLWKIRAAEHVAGYRGIVIKDGRWKPSRRRYLASSGLKRILKVLEMVLEPEGSRSFKYGSYLQYLMAILREALNSVVDLRSSRLAAEERSQR